MMNVAILRRELPVATRIPYAAHVSERIVRTTLGDYLQTFRLGGASFESADDDQLNNWHERLNVLWRNIASPNVALWAHVIRRREPHSAPPEQGQGFAGDLSRKYFRKLAGETLMINELYLSILYRLTPGAASHRLACILAHTATKSPSGETLLEVKDALDACDKLGQTLQASLGRYDPEALAVYTRSAPHGRVYSTLLEFLAALINGEHQPIPLPRAPLSETLATTRLFFGNEALEYRTPTHTRVGAVLGIKEYPTPSVVGMVNRLLSAPFEFVLTQSFTFLTKATSQALLQRQYNRMLNAGDFAISQSEELKHALDALTSNEFVMGDHHFSLQVLSHDMRTLNDHLALARSILADTGMTVAREDLALEAAFWAQLPGNFPTRPRKAPITSRNFAALVPFHNYPSGRPTGNHWGEALTVLITSARSPYHFSLHASDPTDPEGGSRKDTGHTLICGPTGSGKSVLIGFLVAALSRRGVTQVIFDKDRGLEPLVRKLDGSYLPLRNGVPTGFNPLQLESTPSHLEFLKIWLQALVGRALSVKEASDLDQALRGTLALEAPARRLSRLIEFLDPTDSEGVHARLARWCASTRGDYAWAFDNVNDALTRKLVALRESSVVGFDVTEFLDNATVRAPITLYLFHLIRRLLDGRRLVCWMDEFWRLLADTAFEAFAKDGPKTWRKLNGVMCLATQSTSDVLSSPISRTLIEQTPTKILFPNVDADCDEYIEGFGLTEREFKLIKEELEPGSRSFLIKQGHHSVVCQLDLKGFDQELAILSRRSS